jgi:hypothetical protein
MSKDALAARAKPPLLASRRKKTARQRTYRQRQRRHEFVAPVPVSEAALDFLARNRWLSERDSHDPKRVAAAIQSLLETSAKI